MSEALDDLLADLHAQLEATAELPIRPSANRWIGEAEAVAADLADREAEAATVRERVGHVRTLLESADGTGNDEADERVRAALERVDDVERRLDERS